MSRPKRTGKVYADPNCSDCHGTGFRPVMIGRDKKFVKCHCRHWVRFRTAAEKFIPRDGKQLATGDE